MGVLVKDFETDIEAGTFPEHHRFLTASALAKRFNIDEASVRKRISRARKALLEGFLKKVKRQIVPDDIIQNQEWNGYRLNPYLLQLKPSQLRHQPSQLSQLGQQTVTPRGQARLFYKIIYTHPVTALSTPVHISNVRKAGISP